MKKLLMIMLILGCMVVPVSAEEFTAPAIPESGAEWMPEDPQTFTDGLLEILGKVIPKVHPAMTECVRTCLRIAAVILLVGLVRQFPGDAALAADLAGSVAIGLVLLGASQSLISLGADTVRQISDYGKLLLPVMTSAMAAGGAVTASAGLYLGTAFFDSLLSAAVTHLMIPMVYIFLALSIGNNALREDMLKQMKDIVKWAITWSLKIVIYIFTGYMGITGVVSGTTDAAALKAAKLTISGVVPVVGGILSDASETVLVGANVVKNAAGIYGLLALVSLWIGPFLQIGLQYLCLKVTGALCAVFGSKSAIQLISDFTAAMGLLLAMTGTVCLMFLISTVCFMKGVG